MPGRRDKPRHVRDLLATLSGGQRVPIAFRGGPERVRRMAIVSGSAADLLPAAVAAGFDAFLTGEPREHVTAEARELGVHFVAAGHYATETFGVRAFAEHLGGRFNLPHKFIDAPTGF